MAHTITYFDGFEIGDVSEWYAPSGGAVETSLVSLSRYSRRFNVAAATAYVQYTSAGLNAPGWWDTAPLASWHSFHFRIATLPGAGLLYYIWGGYDSVGARWRSYAAVDQNGKVGFYNDGWGWAWSAATISINTWYVISIKDVFGAAGQVIARGRDSGATVASVTHGSVNADAERGIHAIGPVNTSTGDAYFDNLVVEGGASIDDPVNLLTTKYAVGLLAPVGTGYYDAFTGTYADVDETPPDGDTTKRTAGGGGPFIFTQTVQQTAGLVAAVGTVRGVKAMVDAKGAGVVNSRACLRSGGTYVETSDFGPAAYCTFQKMCLTDPSTTLAWTISAVDSVQVGCNHSSGAGTTSVTGAYVEVLYSTTSVSRIRRIDYYRKPDDPMQRFMDYKGRIVPYNELRPNRWVRRMTGPPRADSPASFWKWRDLTLIEGLVWTQDESGMSVEIRGSKDDFVDSLIRRISDSSGGL